MSQARAYLTETEYPARFQREHAPLWIAAVTAALGFAQPRGVLRCGEIGCGSGFGLLALAAANPAIEFHGWDLNPAHVEAARATAAEAGLANVRFDCADIAGLAPEPEGYDLLLCHGVYSWVDARVRAAIGRFAARSLRPRGVFCLHYMTLPGGAAFEAFHALFAALPGRGGVEARVADGLDHLKALETAGAGFFALHPHAAGTLDHLRGEAPAYVAHDYLTADFHPLAVGDVMRAMAGEGLRHLGSATPLENIDALSLPGATQPLIAREADPVLRETLKDMARNQALRIDLYAQGPLPLPPAAHMAALDRLRIAALPWAPASGGLTFSTRIGPLTGPKDVFSPLLERLAAGPAGLGDLAALAPFRGDPALLNRSVQVLIWAGVAHPLAPEPVDPEPARRLNRLLIARAVAGGAVPALAAPMFGTALLADPGRLAKGDPGMIAPHVPH